MGPRFRAGSVKSQQGFTYFGLLIAVAVVGVALAAAGTLTSTDAKRGREADLLFAGDQFQRAIASYWEKSPVGQPQRLPKSFDDLLDDRRWPTLRRHLRKVYVDPMMRSTDWGIIEGPSGGVMGVYSRSAEAPLKHDGFPKDYEQFAKAGTYRDWRFAYAAAAASAASGAADAASSPFTGFGPEAGLPKPF